MAAKLPITEVFSQHPEVMSGALVFKGTRIPVQTFFDHLDHGGTIEQFLEWYEGARCEQLEAAAQVRLARSLLEFEGSLQQGKAEREPKAAGTPPCARPL